MGHELFYATVATSAATIFGIGGALLASRFVALSERAARYDMERRDHLNRSVERDIQDRWAERARESALADLHPLTRDLRTIALTPLVTTTALAGVPMMVLAGWVPDTAYLRAILTAAFVISVIAWALTLWARLMRPVHVFTQRYHRDRLQRHAEATAKGADYLVSGDPEALKANITRLLPGLERTRRGRRLLRRLTRVKSAPPKSRLYRS